MPFPLTPPLEGEYAPFYAPYVRAAMGDDLRALLAAQPERLREMCTGLSEAAALHRYADGKWSVKEVVGHLADTERVFSYRALRIARGDETALAPFDEDLYVTTAAFDRRPIGDLVDDFEAVRRQTLSLLAGLEEDAWLRSGTASGHGVSVRALFFFCEGHVRHHMDILVERYGVPASADDTPV